MLDCHSLQNLLQVSGHSGFGPALHTLEICTDHLIEDIPIIQPDTWIEPAEHEMSMSGSLELADVYEEAYKHRLADQKRLGKCGLDTAYLTRALINLSNCKRIYINNTHQPWGAASPKRQTGIRLTSSIAGVDSINYVKRIIKVILAAIIASPIHPTISRYPPDVIDNLLSLGCTCSVS